MKALINLDMESVEVNFCQFHFLLEKMIWFLAVEKVQDYSHTMVRT